MFINFKSISIIVQQLPFPVHSYCKDFCLWTLLTDITGCWLWTRSLDVHCHAMQPLTRDTNGAEAGLFEIQIDILDVFVHKGSFTSDQNQSTDRTPHRDRPPWPDLAPAFILVAFPVLLIYLFWHHVLTQKPHLSAVPALVFDIVRSDNGSSPSWCQLRCTQHGMYHLMSANYRPRPSHVRLQARACPVQVDASEI